MRSVWRWHFQAEAAKGEVSCSCLTFVYNGAVSDENIVCWSIPISYVQLSSSRCCHNIETVFKHDIVIPLMIPLDVETHIKELLEAEPNLPLHIKPGEFSLQLLTQITARTILLKLFRLFRTRTPKKATACTGIYQIQACGPVIMPPSTKCLRFYGPCLGSFGRPMTLALGAIADSLKLFGIWRVPFAAVRLFFHKLHQTRLSP